MGDKILANQPIQEKIGKILDLLSWDRERLKGLVQRLADQEESILSDIDQLRKGLEDPRNRSLWGDLKARADALEEEIHSLYEARKEYTTLLQKDFLKIKKLNASKTHHDIKLVPDASVIPQMKLRWEKALGELSNFIVKKDNDPVLDPVNVDSSEGRANYGMDTNTLNHMLNWDWNVYVHELGHMLETHLPGALEASRKFLRYRAAKGELISLQSFPDHKYESWEKGYEDDFEKVMGARDKAVYTGKLYGSRIENAYATELISLGLERFIVDPVDFTQKDPEYAAFLMGIMDGSLREHPYAQSVIDEDDIPGRSPAANWGERDRRRNRIAERGTKEYEWNRLTELRSNLINDDEFLNSSPRSVLSFVSSIFELIRPYATWMETHVTNAINTIQDFLQARASLQDIQNLIDGTDMVVNLDEEGNADDDIQFAVLQGLFAVRRVIEMGSLRNEQPSLIAAIEYINRAFSTIRPEGFSPAISESDASRRQKQLLQRTVRNPYSPKIDQDDFNEWLAFEDARIPKLAQQIEQERSFDGIGILADALEEAGAYEQDLIDHFRSLEGEDYIPGTWGIDLLLGRTPEVVE